MCTLMCFLSVYHSSVVFFIFLVVVSFMLRKQFEIGYEVGFWLWFLVLLKIKQEREREQQQEKMIDEDLLQFIVMCMEIER